MKKRYRKPTRAASPKAVIKDLRQRLETAEQSCQRTHEIAERHWHKFTQADSYRAAAESRVRELEQRLESLCPPMKDYLSVTSYPQSMFDVPPVLTAELKPVQFAVGIEMRTWQCHDRYQRAALKQQCMEHILREVRQHLDQHFLLNGQP